MFSFLYNLLNSFVFQLSLFLLGIISIVSIFANMDITILVILHSKDICVSTSSEYLPVLLLGIVYAHVQFYRFYELVELNFILLIFFIFFSLAYCQILQSENLIVVKWSFVALICSSLIKIKVTSFIMAFIRYLCFLICQVTVNFLLIFELFTLIYRVFFNGLSAKPLSICGLYFYIYVTNLSYISFIISVFLSQS